MADRILHKRNLITGNVPTTASLEPGELAINVADGKLFLRQSGSVANQIVTVGLSSSLAQTASYVETAQTASYVLNAVSSSFASTASFAPAYVLNSATASMSVLSSSYAVTASYIQTAQTASYVLNAVSSSFSNTASYALNAVSSSFSSTASYVNTLNQNLTLNGDLTLNGTASISYLNVVYETASVIYSSGSNQLGDATNDTQSLIGRTIISGSLEVTGSSILPLITGSLFGTASWANNVVTASYALNALSSSFAQTASYVNPLQQNVYITGSLNMSGSIYNPNSIYFNTTASAITSVGQLGWDDGYGTLDLMLKGGNVNVELGQANVVLIFNDAGTTLNKGEVVYVSGSQGNRPAVKRAIATADGYSATTLGFAAESIPAGAEGYVTTFGFINNINTNGNTGGAPVWLSPTVAGGWTTTKPVAPEHTVLLGYIVRVSNTVGSIFTHISNGWELGELHDVKDTTTTSSYGDLLVKSGSLWINSRQLTGSYGLTGSLSTSGSITLIGTSTLTGSLNITGSTTQIGNNTLLGNTTLSGSIIISGSAITPTIQIYGDTEHNGYIRFDPVTTNINTSISASYIYVSGSTNDLYFSQNGSGYSNVTRLRWLEGNLYTGLLNGGLITSQSSTVYQVSSGSGIIVDLNASYTDNPYPTVTYVNWPNLSASIAPLSSSYDQTFVAIQANGTIGISSTPYINGQIDTQIPVGLVLHQNRSTINGVKTQPKVAYGWKQRSNIFIEAFGPLKLSGLTLSVSGSSTGSLVVGSGTAFQDGANYTVDANDPAYVLDTGTNISKIYRYRQSGSNWVYDTNAGVGYGAIDPTNYSNSGILTPVPVNNWSIQRVYYFPTSPLKSIVVYYGNATYTTELDAIANINIEAFTEAPNTAANAVYLGALVVRYNANFTTAASYKIIPGGLFRAVGGSGGGGGTVTQTLSGLSDVSILSPTNGQPLVYNSTLSKWENASTLTASLSGNASTATTASYALTASFVQTAQTASYVLNAVSSSFALTASFATSASFASTVPASGVIGLNLSQIATGSVSASVSPTQFTVTSGSVTEFVVRGTGVTIGNAITDTHFITGSALITGSLGVTGSISVTQNVTSSRLFVSSSGASTVRVQGSGSELVAVDGATGRLFTVTDDLSTSLFSANTIAGLPVIEAFATNDVNIGKFGTYPIKTTVSGTLAVITGSFTGNAIISSSLIVTGSARITGSLDVTGSITATQIGVGAAPSSSVSLDIRATATATSPAFRVRNNANTQNLMSLTSNGFGISFNASGYNIIAGSSNNLSVGDFSGGNYTINHYSATDTAYIQQNSLSYYETISTSYTNATENLKSATTIGKIAYTGASTQNKVNFVNSTTYWGTGGVYSAGFHWYRSGVSGDPTVTRIASSCTDANRQMWLTPDNSLILLTAPSALAYTASITGFQMYSSTGSISSNPRPHFRTGNGTTVWLGDESRLFNVTASRTIISSSQSTASGSSLTVYGSGSTQPVFTVQGSQGELFSVTDSLSGSLFSVNDISGLPILEVFSDNTTLIGNYLDPMLITTAKVTQTNSGSFVLYSLPTASYDTAFFEYSVKSGSNARAGTIMAIQSGSAVNFTETTTTDFGNTSAISFVVVVTGSAMALTGSSTSGAWTIKTIVRGL